MFGSKALEDTLSLGKEGSEKTAGASSLPSPPSPATPWRPQHHPAQCGVSRVLILHLLLAHLTAPFPALKPEESVCLR